MKAVNSIASVVAPKAGRPLNILGHSVTIKIARHESEGNYYVFEVATPPGHGIPPHVHDREDELIYVLEGEFELTVDGVAYNNAIMVGLQIAGCLCCAAWSFVVSAFILTFMYLTKVLKFTQSSDFNEIGFHVKNCMIDGIDLSKHQEKVLLLDEDDKPLEDLTTFYYNNRKNTSKSDTMKNNQVNKEKDNKNNSRNEIEIKKSSRQFEDNKVILDSRDQDNELQDIKD